MTFDRAWMGIVIASALGCAACGGDAADANGSDAARGSGAGGSGASSASGRGGSSASGNGASGNGASGDGASGASGDGASGASGDGASGASGSSGDGGQQDAGAAGDGGSEAPYANVVAVSASGEAGAYTFEVSIESADIDCTQYADWWEVLREDGSLLYRRILEHSHTDENGTSDEGAPGNTFTRSGGPVAIDASEPVLVRAHMSTGGYRGNVMRGDPTSDFENAPDIGADFATEVEDQDPQPESCAF